MEIFGVGPIELIVILVLGLIVLGPERLPEVGRFLGRQLAKLMAWQQQSPEAQMLQQIRQDFEQEIVDLRDEIVRARQQLDVSADMQRLRDETRSMLSLKSPPPGSVAATQTISAPASPDDLRVTASALPNKVRNAQNSAPVADATAPDPAPLVEEAAPDPRIAPPDVDADELNPAERRRLRFEQENIEPYRFSAPPNGVAHVENGSPAADQEALLRRLQSLASDLQALQEQLRACGVLDPNWQPPSHAAQRETVSS